MRGARRRDAHRRRGRAGRSSTDGRAAGVELAGGEIVRARRVVANVNPKLLFQQLVAPEHLPADFRARIAGYRCGSGTFRMNVALSELPDFTALPGTNAQAHHAAGIIIAPSLAYMERAYFDARTDGWSRGADRRDADSLDRRRHARARPGKHVASLFCQHVHPDLAQVRPGRTWDDARDEVADLMIDTVNRFAPNFKASVLGRRALSPLDLEREFGLIGGDIFHGALALDQLFSARPGARARRLPRAGARPLHVRRGHAPGRRRDRRPRAQRGARDPEGRAAAAVLIVEFGSRRRGESRRVRLRYDARANRHSDAPRIAPTVHARRINPKSADKPGSVTALARYGRHSSRRSVAAALVPPTRGLDEQRVHRRPPTWCCSGWRLPRFTRRRFDPDAATRLCGPVPRLRQPR